MRCRKCRQPGSPINNLIAKLDGLESVSVLSACSGYTYEGHVNLPEKPYILFSVKHIGILESLWRQVFSNLIVPAYLVYNGSRQFEFEIDLPQGWPNRDRMLMEVWGAIDKRVREYK
jgi:hypothetical protein